MGNKPRMSVSMDLDNKWSYLKTHGSDKWVDYPSYFDIVVPRILDFLERRNIKITFFIVGQDAELQRNKKALQMLSAAGHEIANHSFKHEPRLHQYSKQELNDELEQAENSIEAATGVKTRGFRGPGFSISKSTLEVLEERGYDYDASTFPSITNPLARAYFFSKSNLSEEQKMQQKALYGTFSDAFRPIKPYRWQLESGQLLELPVTTMPLLRTPIHFTYLVFLAEISTSLARLYLQFAILMCRSTKTEPSLLLHPLEFLGKEDDKDLGFFPAMDMPLRKKLELMDGFFDLLQKSFTPLTMNEMVSALNRVESLRSYEPKFIQDGG